MKKHISLIVGLIAVAMVSTLAAQTTEDGIVKVVSLKGAARYMALAGSEWKPIKTGLMLKPGAVIQTAADSYVDLVLNNPSATQGVGASVSDEPASSAASSASASSADAGYKPKAVQDAIRIFENSVLSVDKLTLAKTGAGIVSETQLDLKAGRIFGTVKKLSAASIYEIKVPNGVAGIRGTIYLISADGNVGVLTGSVVVSFVSNGAVITKEVPAGYQFSPSTGQVTEIPGPVMKAFIKLAQGFTKYLPNQPPATFMHDHTIYNVSPTQNGQGQNKNNNNQGGNQQ